MKKTICFIILLALTVICAAGAAADDAPANLVLQTSQSQLAAGDTLTVTMNIKAVKPVGRVTASVSYDSSVLKFVSGSGAKDAGGVIQIEQLNGLDTSATITLTFTAASAGSSNISVTSCAVYDAFDEQYELAGAAAAVSVTDETQTTQQQTQPSQASPATDANGVPTQGVLTDLTVVNGKLVPPFMYSIHDYSVTVPYDVTKVEITGKTASLQDHIWYTGNEDCEVGLNVRTITVTDINGNATTYTINVTRLDKDKDETTAATAAAPNDTSADSSSGSEKVTVSTDKDIKQTLLPALYIILGVLVVALVIVIIWIKGKTSGSKEQDRKNTKQRSKIKVSGSKNGRDNRKKK